MTYALNDDPEAEQVIEKVKHMVTYFHKSTLASEKLREIQKRLDLPEHKLIQQVETRWNSHFVCWKDMSIQNEAVRTALCMQDLILSSEKNSFIAEMIRILRPFEAVTTELSAEKCISLKDHSTCERASEINCFKLYDFRWNLQYFVSNGITLSKP